MLLFIAFRRFFGHAGCGLRGLRVPALLRPGGQREHAVLGPGHRSAAAAARRGLGQDDPPRHAPGRDPGAAVADAHRPHEVGVVSLDEFGMFDSASLDT